MSVYFRTAQALSPEEGLKAWVADLQWLFAQKTAVTVFADDAILALLYHQLWQAEGFHPARLERDCLIMAPARPQAHLIMPNAHQPPSLPSPQPLWEYIWQEASHKEQARQRFRLYQQAGLSPQLLSAGDAGLQHYLEIRP